MTKLTWSYANQTWRNSKWLIRRVRYSGKRQYQIIRIELSSPIGAVSTLEAAQLVAEVLESGVVSKPDNQ